MGVLKEGQRVQRSAALEGAAAVALFGWSVSLSAAGDYAEPAARKGALQSGAASLGVKKVGSEDELMATYREVLAELRDDVRFEPLRGRRRGVPRERLHF